MPGPAPDGDDAPLDGALPPEALAELGSRPFGVYVHVPFCASRCGYCDFNTYTATELGGGADQAAYADTVAGEIALAARVLGGAAPSVSTVFFGGGTPTLLPADDLAKILATIDAHFGLAPGAEVTTEANPESVTPRSLSALRAAGFTRISLGMQSAREHVLRVLDRRHTPGRPQQAVREARAAGFESVNLDLIYGAPGETEGDWQASLDAVLAAEVDHVSAYALIVEDGTRLGRQVARGELPMPDDDLLADRYLQAEEALSGHGLSWYEVSNWARPGHACRHNELYWRSDDWWGLGPGAHSHVGGVRWWNVRHPTAYAGRLAGNTSPAQARELLDDQTRRTEDVMLRLRLMSGLPLAALDDAARAVATDAAAEGLLDPEQHAAGRAVLTLRGRLLADAVVRDLLSATGRP
jgi:oxygen-independent coproporphyrinogen-3 oxidase